jgi:hypothetical protein
MSLYARSSAPYSPGAGDHDHGRHHWICTRPVHLRGLAYGSPHLTLAPARVGVLQHSSNDVPRPDSNLWFAQTWGLLAHLESSNLVSPSTGVHWPKHGSLLTQSREFTGLAAPGLWGFTDPVMGVQFDKFT